MRSADFVDGFGSGHLQYGVCTIAVHLLDSVSEGYTPEGAERSLEPSQSEPRKTLCNLVVLRSQAVGPADPEWRAIGRSWTEARQGLEGTHSGILRAWRDLYRSGEEVDSSVLLFRFRKGRDNDYFCWVPADDLRHPGHVALRLIHAIDAVTLRWYVAHRGGPLHAAGVAHLGKGYLFLGPSDAGKSTVAAQSRAAGAIVIDEERVMLSRHGKRFRISSPNNCTAPVLESLFLLRKAPTNRVISIQPQAAQLALCRAVLQHAVGRQHWGPWVRQAFHNMAEVARRVPAYVLEFRKSPDFWDVIDAELGK